MAKIVRQFGRVLWVVVPLVLAVMFLATPKPTAWSDPEEPTQEDPTEEESQGGGGAGEEEEPCLDVEEGVPELECEGCGPMPMPPPYYGFLLGDEVVEFLADPPSWVWDWIGRIYPPVLTPPVVSPGVPALYDSTTPNRISLIPIVGSLQGGSVRLYSGEFHWRIPFPLDPLPAPGPKISFPLFYRSQAKIDGITGNWDIGFHQHFVEVAPGGDLNFYSGRGRSLDRFVRQGSAYNSPLGWTSRLVVLNGIGGSGDSFRLDEYDGRFRQFNSQGYLTLLGDTNGNVVTLTRNPSIASQVTYITDSLNRSYSLSYTNGRLTSLTDPIGRTQTLTYFANGQLASVSTPSTTFLDATGSLVNRPILTSFTYTSGSSSPDLNGNLLGVYDDSGHAQVANQYSSADRVSQQTNALGGAFVFDYQSGMTAVTRPDGELVEYSFDSNGFVDEIKRVTATGQNLAALRMGEPAAHTTTLSRDASCGCGRLLSATFPDGTTWAFTYNSDGGVTSRSVAPGTGVPGTSHVWSYTRALRNGFGVVQSATDPAGRTTTFSHDSATGNLASITFPTVTVGVAASYTPTASVTYRSDGQPLSATGVDGVVRTTQYHSTLAVATGTILAPGAFGITASRTLNPAGRTMTATDPAGGVASYQYDGLGHLAQVAEPGSGTTRFMKWDFRGRMAKLEEENRDASGTLITSNPLWTTTRVRNEAGQLTSETVELSSTQTATTTQTYTVGGKTALMTTPEGRATMRTYDERELPFQVTLGYGSAVDTTSTYNYNLAGVPSQRVDGLGNAHSWTRDLFGRIVVETTPAGIATQRTYATSGAITDVELRNASGALVSAHSLLSNEAGRQYSRIQWGITDQGVKTSTSRSQSVTLRSSGRIATYTDAAGQVWSAEFDAIDRVTAFVSPGGDRLEFSYDTASRLTQRTSKFKRPDTTFHTVLEAYTYDSQSRVATVAHKDASGNVLRSSTWQYDGRGGMVRATDALGNRTDFTLDGRSRVVSTSRELRAGGVGTGTLLGTAVTGTTFDGDGFVVARTDPRNNTTSNMYDAVGRLSRITAADLAQWNFQYDDASRMTRWTDPNGSVVDQAFDADGRVVSRAISRGVGVLGPTAENFAYDAMGAMTAAGDGDSTISWEFDDFHAVEAEFAGQTSLPSQPTTTFTHGADGRLTGVGYGAGVTSTYTMDSLGRPDVVSVGGSTLSDVDWTGPWPVRRTLGGVRQDLSLDTLGRATTVSWSTVAPPATLRQYSYSWDLTSRLQFEARNDLGGIGSVYRYDSLSSLVSSRLGVPNPAAEHASPGSQPYVEGHDFGVDSTRNRSSFSTLPGGGGPPSIVSYAVNSRNQYTSVGGTARTVSPNGELRTDGVLAYTYDYRGRLVEVRVQATNALVASYGWDPIDRRDSRSVTGGVNERYLYAGKQIAQVYEMSGTPFVRSRLYYSGAGTAPVAADLRDEGDLDGDLNTTEVLRVLLLRDHAQSLGVVATTSGSTLEEYRYDEFGRVTIHAPSGAPRAQAEARLPDGFQGYVRDEETGLLTVGTRSYTVSSGRFLQADPGGAWFDSRGQGSEAQAFEHAPTTFWDPTGLDGEQLSGDIGDLPTKLYAKGLPRSTPLVSVMQNDPTGIIGTGPVTEKQTAAINHELKTLNDSVCYNLIFRGTATQEAFKQAFNKCHIIIVSGHGDVGGNATAPGVTFDKFTADNNPITVPATSPVESYIQASCGCVFYAKSFEAWLKPARSGQGAKVTLPDKSLYDPDRTIKLYQAADFLLQQLQALKDYPCCPLKNVCVLFGKDSNDGAVPADKWDEYFNKIKERMQRAAEANK